MTAPRRTTPRNWNVDVVRTFAIAVVVVVHWISVRVTGGGGAVRGDLTLHGRPIWALSRVLQVMPLFFLAGGFANTLVVDLMTIYLWHIPVIAAGTGAALAAPALLLPRDPQTWWLTRPLWILGCGIALLGVVRLTTYWDLFCAGYAARTTSTAALTGALAAAASVYAIW